MGTYRSTFIGPYLVVKDSIKTITIVEYFHPETGKKMKTKFDPNTGAEGIKKNRTENVSIENSPWDFDIEGFSEDEFFKPAYCGAPKGHTTWVCNSGDLRMSRPWRSYPNDEVFVIVKQCRNGLYLLRDTKGQEHPLKKSSINYFNKYGKEISGTVNVQSNGQHMKANWFCVNCHCISSHSHTHYPKCDNHECYSIPATGEVP